MLGTTLAGGVARRIEAVPRLAAMQLEPAVTRKEFLARWRDVIVTIVDRGTYLDVEDVGGLVDASFPGADEIFGLLVLAQLLAGSGAKDAADRWKRFVIDTAPTGHTLQLLRMPDFRAGERLFALLWGAAERVAAGRRPRSRRRPANSSAFFFKSPFKCESYKAMIRR